MVCVSVVMMGVNMRIRERVGHSLETKGTRLIQALYGACVRVKEGKTRGIKAKAMEGEFGWQTRCGCMLLCW